MTLSLKTHVLQVIFPVASLDTFGLQMKAHMAANRAVAFDNVLLGMAKNGLVAISSTTYARQRHYGSDNRGRSYTS